MATNAKDKSTTTTQPPQRTYLISSTQLTDIMWYLMSRPYAEVVKLMNMLGTLGQLDPKIGADFVKQQSAGMVDAKKWYRFSKTVIGHDRKNLIPKHEITKFIKLVELEKSKWIGSNWKLASHFMHIEDKTC